MSLSPTVGVTVQQGAPVTFSGELATALTFSVASSEAQLSSPDIDSGLGSLQAGTSPIYTFTSTKAAATPGTVYWAASFSDAGIPDCEGLTPSMHTTKARALTVLAAPAPRPDPPPPPPPTPPPAPSTVSLAGTNLATQSNGTATGTLACVGGQPCSGKLTLQAMPAANRKHGRKPAHPVTIGLASFAIPAGQTASVTIHLNGVGRALLNAGHGRLTGLLAIAPTGSATPVARTVHLVENMSHGRAKHKK
ncbi:MAG TPA: hypothetical protein VID70_01145 [Solirubrobacteraceae bacterium]